jgi:hypothetical protein
MSRLRDMMRVNVLLLRNPLASLLAELVRLGSDSPDSDYELLVEKAIIYGYDMEYSQQWRGNISIRNALNEIALVCQHTAHKLISTLVLNRWSDMDSIQDKEPWYTHDLRILLQHLLANDQCSNDLSSELARRLDRLNELTHTAAPG